jgi:two-component system nitrate/nitrite response regulator NarL
VIRILLCDYHVVFAESLAHLLAMRGKQVVGVTHNLDEATTALQANVVDVFLLDVVFGAQRPLDRLVDLRRAAPHTHVVLLSGRVDQALVLAARVAGVRAIGDKRQPVAEIIQLLDRVHAGECVRPTVISGGPAAPRQRRWPANHAQRLAAFLTPREREVLSALVCGDDTKKVARSLGIAPATARCHIQSLLTKMGAHSRLEVATVAVRNGMVSPRTGEWLIAVD